jgi:meso-butanediol dehydrogenase/(S,S)-butanediol dehydrogenase/diacetyl reductase
MLGTFLFARAAIPTMIAQGRGVIINLSSVLGLVGDPLLPIYSATKAGILGLTRSIAVSYGNRGIRSVAICPGDIDSGGPESWDEPPWDTPGLREQMEREYPLKRIGESEEVARVACFLASDDASFVSGSHVLVDGGILSRLYNIYGAP